MCTIYTDWSLLSWRRKNLINVSHFHCLIFIPALARSKLFLKKSSFPFRKRTGSQQDDLVKKSLYRSGTQLLESLSCRLDFPLSYSSRALARHRTTW